MAVLEVPFMSAMKEAGTPETPEQIRIYFADQGSSGFRVNNVLVAEDAGLEAYALCCTLEPMQPIRLHLGTAVGGLHHGYLVAVSVELVQSPSEARHACVR